MKGSGHSISADVYTAKASLWGTTYKSAKQDIQAMGRDLPPQEQVKHQYPGELREHTEVKN